MTEAFKPFDLIDLRLYLVEESQDEILISDGRINTWLSRSLIKLETAPSSKRDEIIVTLPKWLARLKGLI